MVEIDDDDFELIASKTTARILQPIEKASFSDGAVKGSQTAFQKGFDRGFEEGIKQGKLIGINAANLRLEGKIINQEVVAQLLHCHLCEKA